MIPASLAFDRYVNAARQGRTALWRVLLGTMLIVAVYVAWFGAVYGAGSLFSGKNLLESLEDDRLFVSPVEAACFLASFLGIWLGVWLAVRALQRRPLQSVLGADGRISRRNFARGFAAVSIALLLTGLAELLVDPSIRRGSILFGEWLLWLAPMTALLLVQTSAEEILCRGYLVQSLAARFRSPLIWGVLPGLLFTLLHWDGGFSLLMNAAFLTAIAAFAAATTILVYVTGDLGAAMGVHFGNNVLAILFFAPEDDGVVALFVGRSLKAPDWATSEIISLGLIGVASSAVSLLLLLHARSPLRVTSPS